MKRILLAITLCHLAAAAPAQANWGDFWDWLSGLGGSSGESDSGGDEGTSGSTESPPPPPPPTEEEVEAVVDEIVTSASSNGQQVNSEAIEDYATRLAMTLKTLSPEQRERVLNGT